MVVFQNITHCLVHAPGGCVPALVAYLQKRIPADDHFKLLTLQQAVQVKLGAYEPEDLMAEDDLKRCMEEVKTVANPKKQQHQDKTEPQLQEAALEEA